MISRGFTPLHPESRSLQAADEWQIKFESTGKSHPLGRGVTGFTLIEALISTALMIIIAGIVFVAFNTASSVGFINTDFIYLQQQTRQTIDGMSREIRQNRVADGVNISSGCARIDFTIGGNAISYYLNANSQIIREYPAGTTRIIANRISSLCFSAGGNIVQINVTATTNSQGRNLSFALAAKVAMRN